MYFGIKDACKVRFVDIATGNVLFYSDYANSFNISLSSDSAVAKAAGSDKITWAYGKKGQLKMSAQVVPMQLFSLAAGAVESSEVTQAFKREVLTVDSGTSKVTLADMPTSGSMSIFTVDTDLRTHLQAITVGTPSTGLNEYSISGKDITFNTSQKGKSVVIYYNVTTPTAAQISKIKSTVFGKAIKIQGVTSVKTDTGIEKLLQVTCPVATPQSSMELTFSATDPSSFDFTFDLAPDANNDIVVLEAL